MSGTKICSNCGKELGIAVKFCNGCGTPQAVTETVRPTERVRPTETVTPVKNVEESTGMGKKLFPLGLATGFLLSAVLFGVVFSGKEEPSSPESLPPSAVESSGVTGGISGEVAEEVGDLNLYVETEEDLSSESEEMPEVEAEPEPELAPEPEVEVEPEVEAPAVTVQPVLGVDVSNVARKQIYVSSAVASSTFPNWQHKTYGASNTLDGDTNTAWVENVSGLGRGEWVEHRFTQNEVVQEIQFYNGYGGVYEKNGVLTQVKVSLSGGESFTYDVVGHWNTLVLPYAVESSWVRLTIMDAYSNGDQDTCISEILIFNKAENQSMVQSSNGQAGIYGDLSGMTLPQAKAMLEKIQGFEHQVGRDYAGNTSSVVKSLGVIFDGGNGIPVLFLLNEYWYEVHWFEMELWEWDGNALVPSPMMSQLEQVGTYADKYNGASLDTLLRKGNQYFVEANHEYTGDAHGIYPRLQFALERGRVTNLASGALQFTLYQEEELPQVIGFVEGNSLFQPFVTPTFREEFYGSEGTYGMYLYNPTFGAPDDYEVIATTSRGYMGSEYSGGWTDSGVLRGWLSKEIDLLG